MQAIKDVEAAFMLEQAPQPGLVELMRYLTSRGVRKGILTRNFEDPVRHLVEKFLGHEEVGVLEPVVTREFDPPKPRPEGLWFIAKAWGLGPCSSSSFQQQQTSDVVAEKEDTAKSTPEVVGDIAEALQQGDERLGRGLIMVGDSLDDMTAGRRAGAATVLLVNEVNKHLGEHEHTDLVIGRLDDLVEILERGLVVMR